MPPFSQQQFFEHLNCILITTNFRIQKICHLSSHIRNSQLEFLIKPEREREREKLITGEIDGEIKGVETKFWTNHT